MNKLQENRLRLWIWIHGTNVIGRGVAPIQLDHAEVLPANLPQTLASPLLPTARG